MMALVLFKIVQFVIGGVCAGTAGQIIAGNEGMKVAIFAYLALANLLISLQRIE